MYAECQTLHAALEKTNAELAQFKGKRLASFRRPTVASLLATASVAATVNGEELMERMEQGIALAKEAAKVRHRRYRRCIRDTCVTCVVTYVMGHRPRQGGGQDTCSTLPARKACTDCVAATVHVASDIPATRPPEVTSDVTVLMAGEEPESAGGARAGAPREGSQGEGGEAGDPDQGGSCLRLMPQAHASGSYLSSIPQAHTLLPYLRLIPSSHALGGEPVARWRHSLQIGGGRATAKSTRGLER